MPDLLVGENSYVSLPEANAIVSSTESFPAGSKDKWINGLSDRAKINLLLSANETIEGVEWKGERVIPAQRLSFPRIPSHGLAIDKVLESVKRVQVFLALGLLMDPFHYDSIKDVPRLFLKGIRAYM